MPCRQRRREPPLDGRRRRVSFDALLEESRQFGQAWDIVFVAALPGTGTLAPTSAQAQEPLQRMVESIKSGAIGRFIPFDAYGEPVQFA